MRRFLLIVTLAGMVLLAGCGGLGESIEERPNPSIDDPSEGATEGEDVTGTDSFDVDGELQIHHIDVGQGDSTLIRTPDGETILIDTGDWQEGGRVVIEYLDAHDIERIDHLIATHAHADHIGGHAAIIDEFETNRGGIGAVYDPGIPHTSQTYENYLDAVETHDIDLFLVQEGDELPIEDDALSGLVVNPPADEGEDLNAHSVAIVFEFGEIRYLTTGDAEAETEARMLDAWADELDADVYQAGHHGSSTSSTPVFMDAVSPEVAVISSGFDSQYGHPHDETLEAFADRGIETYWTGVHGDVVITTDGTSFDVETAKAFSNDPAALLEAKRDGEPNNSTPPIGVTG